MNVKTKEYCLDCQKELNEKINRNQEDVKKEIGLIHKSIIKIEEKIIELAGKQNVNKIYFLLSAFAGGIIAYSIKLSVSESGQSLLSGVLRFIKALH